MNTEQQASTTGKAHGDIVRLAAAQQVPLRAPAPIFTPQQFAERNPAITIGQVRWAVFHEETNGLAESGAITRFGRRILIDEEKFFAWLFHRKAA